MRRRILVVVATGALALVAAVPAAAGAAGYKVTNKSGRTVGRVVPGPLPSSADRIGVVRNLTEVRGAVYSGQSSSGCVGWPVSNGRAYVAWATKANDRRFLIKKVPWSAASGRATRIASGKWIVQRRVEGRWVTIGGVQKGCRGQWAAGAARLLLWRR